VADELRTALAGLEAILVDRTRPIAGRLRQALIDWREHYAAIGSEGSEAGDARLAALDQALRSNLPQRLNALADLLGATEFTFEDLPAVMRDRWVNAAGQQLIEITPVENLNDNAAAARFVAEVQSILPNATGLPVVYQQASRTIVRAFTQALGLALIMVTILLAVFLRNGRDVLLVIVPILFAATVTAGLAAVFGLPFNFANIIALPRLVGVGVDNGIHMVHRMRTEPPADADPLRTSTSRAVLASGLTTIASFGNLAFSAHFGMSSMGQLLTIGMLVTLAATLILLPALLRIRPAG
jgi:hypothetical protein